MRVMHQIDHCRDCPMSDWDRDICQHPLAWSDCGVCLSIEGAIGEDEPPKDCPLRAGELLIQLRTKT